MLEMIEDRRTNPTAWYALPFPVQYGPMSKYPPYNAITECPKCGHHKITTIYSKGTVLRRPWHCKHEGEHLCRHCKRCGYSWAEATRDAQKLEDMQKRIERVQRRESREEVGSCPPET